MLPFRKILLPIDYSEPCRATVPYVQDMLHHFDVELTLVHAYAPMAATIFAGTQEGLIDPGFPDRLRAAEEERLHLFAQNMFSGRHVELIAELGEPGCVIYKIARQQEADLIMLATHGHGPVRRLLLGSVTAKVLHDAATAVWTGVGSALMNHAPTVPYGAIVCALGGPDEDEAILRAAGALADVYSARVSLVHTIQTPVMPKVDFSPYRKELMDAARCRLRELKARFELDAPVTVIDAPIADGVRDEVLLRKADLVIAGRGHCQNGVGRMWSHLYSIVRESPCPVLSV